MLTAALKAAGIACLLMLAASLVNSFYVWQGIAAQSSQLASEGHLVAVFTIRTEAAIANNLAVNLQAVTGERGHLDRLTRTIGMTGYSISGTASEIEKDLWRAIAGVRSEHGYRRGVLDFTESLSETSEKVGDTVLTVANLSEGIRTGYFECPGLGCSQSRLLAVSGEFMRTADAARRTMETVSKATPEFTANVNGITADFHFWTESNLRPKPWYKSGSTVGKIGLGLCRLLC